MRKILILLTLFLANLTAQRVQLLTPEEGYPVYSVNSIYQDKAGFIWTASNQGLFRYDGYNFSRINVKSSSNFSADDFASIYEDSKNNFWIGTISGGLYKYKRNESAFEQFINIPQDTFSIHDNNVICINETKKGELLLGFWVGFAIFNHSTGKFQNFYKTDSVYTPELIKKAISISGKKNSISINKTGNYLNEKKEFYIDKPTRFLIYAQGEFVGKDLYDYGSIENSRGVEIWNMAKVDNYYAGGDIKNRVVVTTIELEKGKYYLRYRNDDSHSLHNWNAIPPENKNLWGIILTPIEENEFREVSALLTKHTILPGISSNRVNSVLEDKTGKIWIGTENGLTVFERDKNKFKNIILASSNAEHGYINKIVEYNGVIIAACNSGLYSIDENNYAVKLLYNKSEIKDICLFENGKLLFTAANKLFLLDIKYGTIGLYYDGNTQNIYNNFGKLYVDKAGSIWCGIDNGGLILINTGRFQFYSYTGEFPVEKVVTDKYGRKFSSKYDYLTITDVSGKQSVIKIRPDSLSVIHDFSINKILPGNDDDLWLATKAGLVLFNIKTKKQTRYFLSGERLGGNNRFNNIIKDNYGNIWGATFEGGLVKFNVEQKKFTSFTEKNGLPSNNIISLVYDGKKYLWLGTDKGLSRFDIEKDECICFDVKSGLPGNRFIEDKAFIGNDGTVYMATSKGSFYFNPVQYRKNEYMAPVIISSIKVFNQEKSFNYDPVYLDEVDFNYDEKLISFEIAALNYIEPDKNTYLYMLEGFDNQWNNLGKSRNITYTNLDPGTYKLLIKTINNDGVLSSNTKIITVNILPPWYLTVWAYLLYAVVIGLVFYLYRRYDLNKLKIENEIKLHVLETEKLRETDKIKSDFFANISHEFRTPLTLILEPIHLLKESLKEKRSFELSVIIENNAKRLLNLINQLLDLSRIESGNMKPEVSSGNIVEFIRLLTANFETSAKSNGIDIIFYSPLQQLDILFDKDKIEKILFNLLSNALKFTGPGGKIFVNVEQNKERVYVTVKDTGVGIPEDILPKIFERFYKGKNKSGLGYEGTGIGLAYVKELIEIHRGQIEVESKPGEGTSFRFWLHTDSKVYRNDELVDDDNYKQVNLISNSSVINIDGKIIKKEPEKTLLVVEDNQDMRQFIKAVLEKEYKLIEAVDGVDGLEKAKEFSPDIIVSDVMMPKMDGIEFTAKLRKDFSLSHIPVILLTAKAGLENKLEGYESGADEYLIKPFNKEELLVRLRNLLENRKILADSLKNGILTGNIIKVKEEKKITRADKDFIASIYRIIEENYKNPDFDVESFSRNAGVSQTQLRRKMSALIGKSPVEFLRSYRLSRAAELISEKGVSVSEASYETGFNNLPYFSKCFLEEFGIQPSELNKKA